MGIQEIKYITIFWKIKSCDTTVQSH